MEDGDDQGDQDDRDYRHNWDDLDDRDQPEQSVGADECSLVHFGATGANWCRLAHVICRLFHAIICRLVQIGPCSLHYIINNCIIIITVTTISIFSVV